MYYYYQVPIVNGYFVGIDYSDIVEGCACQRHVDAGYGFVKTIKEFPELEAVSELTFLSEMGGD